uniref:Cytosolic Fe-S cluster assembly factor NUBP2 homolog n=1 Tax=Amphimedon queenslandica TaxID=400682 RepID=A0A1X7T5T8_AMPQE
MITDREPKYLILTYASPTFPLGGLVDSPSSLLFSTLPPPLAALNRALFLSSALALMQDKTAESLTAGVMATVGLLTVGILDIDLCGPSIPHMFSLTGRDVHQGTDGWIPVYVDDTQNEAVVWRGPKKNAMIKQFLSDVVWGQLDYLIIDTPPGTSDEHISVVENIKSISPDGAVLVTTPQGVSLSDVRREVSFCKKILLPVIGIIENMSGFVCPHCSECTNVFSTGGGEELAKQCQVPFLGCIPIDPLLVHDVDKGLKTHEYSLTTRQSISDIINKLLIN